MKKIFSYLLVLVLLMAAVSALKIIENEDEVSITKALNEGLYITAGKIIVDAPIKGDITAFGVDISVEDTVSEDIMTCGGNININSAVKGHAHICGGDISINGPIGGDLTSGGGNININGEISKDVRIIGGSININGKIGGDILILGGSVNINGPVGGDIAVTAGELTINGIVEGSVDVGADKIKLGKDALIKGDLTYTSTSEAVLKEEQVEGTITKKIVKKRAIPPINKFNSLIFGGLALLLTAIVVVLITPSMSNKLADNIKQKFWKTLLFGLIALIVIPIAAVLIMITVIGIPVGIILLILYILAIYLAKIFAALYVGKLVMKKSKKLIIPMVAGIIIYVVLVNIPFISGFVRLLAILLGLGAITTIIFTKTNNNKKKKSRKKR